MVQKKSASSDTDDAGPYVPADRSVTELTVKAVVLGLVLNVVLMAANTYLGLRAGLTISASIPAAVISMERSMVLDSLASVAPFSKTISFRR